MAIKGLIFDLDGTVTLTEQLHADAFSEVFKRHGLKFTKEDDARFSGRGAERTFPEFFLENGITLTQEQIEQYVQEKRAVYDEMVKKNPVLAAPGVEKFLERQMTKGMKIAMSTGNRLESTEFILGKIGLQKYFPVIVTNRDVELPKPAPDIFLKAAEKLGLKPEECIVFEDAVNGVDGAKKAGMRCIAMKTTSDPEKLLTAGADHLVLDFNEVTDDLLQ